MKDALNKIKNKFSLNFMKSLMLYFLLFTTPAIAQTKDIDSLLHLVTVQVDDTNKVNTLMRSVMPTTRVIEMITEF